MPFKTIFAKFKQHTLALAGITSVFLVLATLFFGFTALVKFLFPLFALLAVVSIGIFVIFVLPLSLIRSLRPRLSMLSLTLSLVCGISIWLHAFLVIVGYLGWLAIFFFFIFHSVVPVAAVALFINGQRLAGLILLAGLGITYAMRFYSLWLDKLIFEQDENEEDDIIDVEAKIR